MDETSLAQIGPKIDLNLCPSCHHTKHVGRNCGYQPPAPPAPLKPVAPCECNDTHARKADKGKTGGWHLLPWDVLGHVADIYDYGSRKYAANSWQDVPPDPETKATPRERYEQAMFRHWAAFKRGEWLDPESHKPHLAHFCWGALAVFWFELKERT